ncbi:MAG: flagellar biosynthesis anti-sigma factor FlgM [bacterium]
MIGEIPIIIIEEEVMRIDGISEPVKSEIIKKTETGKKVKGVANLGKSKDAAIFSSASKRLSETQSEIQIAKTQMQAMPDVRTDIIEEVREKIKQGYYNTPEFADQLAEKLMKDFGIQK